MAAEESLSLVVKVDERKEQLFEIILKAPWSKNLQNNGVLHNLLKNISLPPIDFLLMIFYQHKEFWEILYKALHSSENK